MAHSIEFTMNSRRLEEAMRRSPAAVDRAANKGLIDIKNDWVMKSVNIAPIDTGNLRAQTHGVKVGNGVNSEVLIKSNALDGGFNYSYYIHEGPGTTHSGEKKYLDVVGRNEFNKWVGMLEREIKEELRRAGW